MYSISFYLRKFFFGQCFLLRKMHHITRDEGRLNGHHISDQQQQQQQKTCDAKIVQTKRNMKNIQQQQLQKNYTK